MAERCPRLEPLSQQFGDSDRLNHTSFRFATVSSRTRPAQRNGILPKGALTSSPSPLTCYLNLMLSRLRKLLRLQPQNPNRGDTSADKKMPFITGSQPWLKHYMLAALAHPPNPPSLNALYLQAVSPVSSRRELTVYDGSFIIPAILSKNAASLLDADEDDTGVTTRNLLGHVLAPVSVIVVPDMTTAPPTATLLINDVRVFADRVHQRPVGRVPLVHTDPEVCDALRAIVGRQLASYATATVLERADRAAEIQIDEQPETDTFFEKLLHDPSMPPRSLLSDSEKFAMHARRGNVVGGGVAGDDEHETLAIIPENPTPPDANRMKKPPDYANRADAQPSQRDPDWDIDFTQDPAEGGGVQNVSADPLPQTQHFAIDDDEDEEDDDDDVDDEDDNDNDDSCSPEGNKDGADLSATETRKPVGAHRIQDIVGNVQDDTLDEDQITPTTKRRAKTGDESPCNQVSPNSKSTPRPLQTMAKGSGGRASDQLRKADKTPQKRIRSVETRPGNIMEKERSTGRVDSRSNRLAGSRLKADEPSTEKDVQTRTPEPSQSSKAPQEDVQGAARQVQESLRITRSAARNLASASLQKSGKDKMGLKQSITRNEKNKTKPVSPRTSPRLVEMKSPPRRRRGAEEPGRKPVEGEDEPVGTVSPRSPLRRSPRVQQKQSPLTRSQARRAVHLDTRFALKQPNCKEDEDENKSKQVDEEDKQVGEEGEKAEAGDDNASLPAAAKETVTEKNTDNHGRLQTQDIQKEDNQDKSQHSGKDRPPPDVSVPDAVAPVEATRVERGTKRKALEISSPDKLGGKKGKEEEGPSSYSSEPFLDKIKAEIEEMKRFRDRIDKNPDGYKTYPDGFLPSARPATLRAQRILKFPPPSEKDNRVLDVPESAPM